MKKGDETTAIVYLTHEYNYATQKVKVLMNIITGVLIT